MFNPLKESSLTLSSSLVNPKCSSSNTAVKRLSISRFSQSFILGAWLSAIQTIRGCSQNWLAIDLLSAGRGTGAPTPNSTFCKLLHIFKCNFQTISQQVVPIAIVIVFALAILRLFAFKFAFGLRRFCFVAIYYEPLPGRGITYPSWLFFATSSRNFHVSHANKQFRFGRGKNYT